MKKLLGIFVLGLFWCNVGFASDTTLKVGLYILDINEKKYKNKLEIKDIEIGKIMIDEPYSFALVKVVDPNLQEFSDSELMCGKSKVKILKPEWI